MSTQSTKQSGFSAVLSIVAVVVVIGVLGFIGWRLYNQPSAKTNDATSNNQTSSKPPVNNPNPTPTTPQSTYLDIKELGIKIQLSDVIKDAVYSVNGSTATLSTTSITQQSNGACSLANGGMAAVTEYTSDTDPVRGTKIVPNGTTILKLGNNYYVMTLPGAPCWSGSSLGSQQRSAFVDVFKTAQLDQ